MKPLAQLYAELSTTDVRHKDMMQFLSIHARGNVVQIGMVNGAGTAALLYGVEHKGGHVWTINPSDDSANYFIGHPQWTMVEADPTQMEYIRGAGVPEEANLLYIRAEPTMIETATILKCHGHTLKLAGLIIVAAARANLSVRQACEDYAKSFGMRFHIRPSEADLGVIFYPDNKEVIQDVGA
jgi:hypothetical protein